MVYHEIRKPGDAVQNYLVHNSRSGKKWKKISKYIGKGNLSKKLVAEEIAKFSTELKLAKTYKYLSKKDAEKTEEIKYKFDEYLKKAGKSGLEKFREWFFTELTYNSNAIEGNTLSLRDTSLIITEGLIPKKASLREVYEVKNHKAAIDFLEDYRGDLNEQMILKIHSFILKDIDNENARKYRPIQVFIRGSDVVLPPPSIVPRLMRELIKWYKENKKKLHPLELAAIISMKFVTIHPFVDGNGRVSRLIMNFLLKKNKYPEINIYFRDRPDYMDCVRDANEKQYMNIIKFLVKTLGKNYSFVYVK